MMWPVETTDWSALVVTGAVAALVFLAGSALGLVLTAIVVKMPADYFCDSHVRDFWTDKHPVIRTAGRVLKNALGLLLVAIGSGLSLPGIPGPGLLMIVFGLTLLDFPGKRRLERWLIGRPSVLKAINRLRQRYGKPPMILRRPSCPN